MEIVMDEYRYTESGLDNVIISGAGILVDDAGTEVIKIPNINGLHRVIALGIVTRNGLMSGREMRFLRSEMGMTQAELAKMIHREPLTISRWERGEMDIDANAETVVRLHAIQTLGLPVDLEVSEISGWAISQAVQKPILIDGSDPANYQLAA
jgi:transcriptional regulator with XRE-family HTH domain